MSVTILRVLPAIALVGSCLLMVSCTSAPPSEGGPSLEESEDVEQVTEESALSAIMPDAASSDDTHGVSLSNLMQQEFRGSDLQLGEILAENDAYTRYTILYRSGDLTISGIMNVPKRSGPFPLLILNHGYIAPSVYTNGRGLKREQDYLARQGYVVLHPDFRNYAFSDKDEENEMRFRLGYTEDAINAILAVKATHLPYIDADRVGMLGHSMGGGVTINALVVRPDLIDAAVLFAPVSGNARLHYERWTKRRPERAAAMRERYGSPEENPTFWNGISSVTYLDRITAPIMIHHGTGDASVPLEWSEDLEARLRTIGKDVTLHVYENEPHEFIADWTEVMRRTTEFFDAHVKAR